MHHLHGLMALLKTSVSETETAKSELALLVLGTEPNRYTCVKPLHVLSECVTLI